MELKTGLPTIWKRQGCRNLTLFSPFTLRMFAPIRVMLLLDLVFVRGKLTMWFRRQLAPKLEAKAQSDSAIRRKKSSRKRTMAAVSAFCTLMLLNAWSQSGMALPLHGYTFTVLPMSQWSSGKEEIPPAIDPKAWKSGQTAQCGNAFWSYTRWKLGIVQIERCNEDKDRH